MRHCRNESVTVHEAYGDNLGLLLIEAAGLVDNHDGVARVTTDPTIDPDTGLFTYAVTAYLHN